MVPKIVCVFVGGGGGGQDKAPSVYPSHGSCDGTERSSSLFVKQL